MATRQFHFHILFYSITVLVICSQGIVAQSVWILPEQSSSIRIEYLKPTFAEDNTYGEVPSTAVSIVSLYGRAKLSDHVFAKIELPYMQAKVTFPQFYERTEFKESGILNLLVGFDVITSSNSFLECNVRIPTMPEKKRTLTVAGWLGDLERWEAYIPKVTAITIAGNGIHQFESGIIVKARVAPSAWISTSDDVKFKGKSTAFLIDASGGIGYSNNIFDLGVNATSRSSIVPDEVVFNNDQTQFNLGVGVGVTLQSARFGVYYRTYIKDNSDSFEPNDGVIGMNLSYNINE